jgi:CheY-like chemotaxis protein
LIVDDEAANIGVLTLMLKQWGATTFVSTTHPKETLALLTDFGTGNRFTRR